MSQGHLLLAFCNSTPQIEFKYSQNNSDVIFNSLLFHKSAISEVGVSKMLIFCLLANMTQLCERTYSMRSDKVWIQEIAAKYLCVAKLSNIAFEHYTTHTASPIQSHIEVGFFVSGAHLIGGALNPWNCAASIHCLPTQSHTWGWRESGLDVHSNDGKGWMYALEGRVFIAQQGKRVNQTLLVASTQNGYSH